MIERIGLSHTCRSRRLAAPEDGRTPSRRRQAQPFIRISKPSAAPRPLPWHLRQLCLRRIVFDVAPRLRLVLGVTHVCIPVAFLPKLSLASENLIGLFGRVPFPRIHELPQR